MNAEDEVFHMHVVITMKRQTNLFDNPHICLDGKFLTREVTMLQQLDTFLNDLESFIESTHFSYNKVCHCIP